MPPLVAEGLNLALLGMGTVFVFLTMLVFVTMLMSAIFAEEPPENVKSTALPAQQTKKIAAITAAIHQHRSR